MEEGLVCSTERIYGNESESVVAYPNPVATGNILTIEGVQPGSPVQVINQKGVLILNTIATDQSTKLTLHVPPGLYIVRTNLGDVKIVVE